MTSPNQDLGSSGFVTLGLDELATTFTTLHKLQKLQRPESEERNHIVEVRMMLMAAALGRYGETAWTDAFSRAVGM